MLEDDMESTTPIDMYDSYSSDYWSSDERLQDDENQSVDDDARLDNLSERVSNDN